MGKTRLNLNEEEVSRIKGLYNLNEQDSLPFPNPQIRVPGTGEGSQGYRRPGKNDLSFVEATRTQTLPAGLFLNGVDKIDTDSPIFKSAVDKIETVLRMSKDIVPITINGGASSVGKSSGYNNLDLANRRARNFITALKNVLGDSFSRLDITTGDGIVGTATVKNSPEANKEQFVQISYPEKTSIIKLDQTTAIDNTDVATKLRGGDYKEKLTNPKPGNPYMIVKLWYKGDKNEFKKKILDGTGSPAHELVNYKDAANLKFY